MARNSGRGRGGARRRDDRGRGRAPRRGRNRSKRSDPQAFWGDPEELPEPRSDVRMTDDPHAVPRSLGRPPLPGHEQIAEHYFAAVYDRAVATAGALAAAGGLIDPESLIDS